MPFIADEMHRAIRTESDPESVHLCDWPSFSRAFAGEPTIELFIDMTEVRRVVSLALEARQAVNIKVRQPLQMLTIGSTQLAGKKELLDLIRDEVNVKEVVVNEKIEGVRLDSIITVELREEGEVRELIREIQELRKSAKFNPSDRAILSVPEIRTDFVQKHWAVISKSAGLHMHEHGKIFAVRLK